MGRSSPILGLVWALWHLPLFFVAVSYQHSQVGSPLLWLFPVQVVALSVVVTWISDPNRRSTLSAVLLHFMANCARELVVLTVRAEVCYVLIWVVAVVVITILWGPKTLTHERDQMDRDEIGFRTFARENMRRSNSPASQWLCRRRVTDAAATASNTTFGCLLSPSSLCLRRLCRGHQQMWTVVELKINHPSDDTRKVLEYHQSTAMCNVHIDDWKR